MKKLIYVITLFIASTAFVSAQEWADYKYEDLAFIIEFPVEPKRTVQDVETAVGTLKMHMIMHAPTSGDDNAVYSVIRSDYPKSQFENVDDTYNNNILDGAVEGAVTNVEGELVFDDKIIFNGYPGRSVKIEISGGIIYIKAYLVENIMFITQVICLKENDKNESIKRFMDSFNILKIKE